MSPKSLTLSARRPTAARGDQWVLGESAAPAIADAAASAVEAPRVAREKRAPATDTRRFTFEMPRSVFRRLRHRATDHDVTLAALITRYIEQGLAHEEHDRLPS